MRGLKTHRITIGDSLQKIARLYGIEDWREIATINQLQAPFIDGVFQSEAHTGNEHVAKVGDTILIPKLGSTTTQAPTKRSEEIEILTYGLDLDLYNDQPVYTEVEGEVSENGLDLVLAGGLSNLSQQLTIRLTTKEGGLLLHPRFGSRLHYYMGKLDSPETQNKVRFEVERCLRSDFRVQDVKDIEIISNQGKYMVTAKVIPIEPGQPFDLHHYLA